MVAADGGGDDLPFNVYVADRSKGCPSRASAWVAPGESVSLVLIVASIGSRSGPKGLLGPPCPIPTGIKTLNNTNLNLGKSYMMAALAIPDIRGKGVCAHLGPLS